MLQTFALLGQGFLDCLTLMNIFCAVVGCLLGSLIGVLPGLGISGTVAILLPITYGMSPLSALIMISGIYFGSQYGGAITSILVNIPGESTSIVTCFDGHPLAKRGMAGKALSTAAISSFCGGMIGMVGLTFAASTLAKVALGFGKVEFFSIVVFGLILLTSISGKNQLKGLIVVCLGVVLGCIGLDDLYGTVRFTFGIVDLYKGISFVTFVMGVYGITELMGAICIPEEQGSVMDFRMRDQFLNGQDAKQIWKTIIRSSILGFGVGLVPGAGSTLATFFAYGMERSLSKHPEKFGTGLLEGVAAPEAANNAAMYAGMVPLLSLGLPFTSSMALLMSAFIIHGITPGPLFIAENPTLFWGLIASMFVGNVLLLIINLPLVGIWASLLKVDFNILMPLITFITFAGGYAINYSVFDMGVMVACGFVGFFMSACGYNMAALAVGLFLSSTLENSFLGTMTLYHGNLLAALIDRPVAAVILGIAVIALVISISKSLMQYFKKDGGKQ
ncbi:tripartite tricarboxylate transporter permease [uncultured Oscillibacter sp.]|uniref:tripartite tricarboxylate transporter permease n=1 Tax=uncultured Oscillibacter sp. TaxID=876091 RepID=UPI00266FE952|nr:tripartite tricarboxylate transporter permease [uncultured Oscillibacter sp.]